MEADQARGKPHEPKRKGMKAWHTALHRTILHLIATESDDLLQKLPGKNTKKTSEPDEKHIYQRGRRDLTPCTPEVQVAVPQSPTAVARIIPRSLPLRVPRPPPMPGAAAQTTFGAG